MKKFVISTLVFVLPLSASAASVSIASISPTGAIDPGKTVTFSALASGFTDPVYTVSDSVGSNGTIDNIGSFSWTPTVTDAGWHTFTVSVQDAYDHSATTTANILVSANTVVVSSISPGTTVAVGKTVTFSVSAPGFTSPTFYANDAYTGNILSVGTISSNGAFSWVVGNEPGDHWITVVASDNYGHNAQLSTLFTVVSPKVILPLANPATVAASSTLAFTATSTGLTSPTYSITDTFATTSSLTASTMSTAGVFKWTPAPLDIGLHSIVVTASDSLGNAASSTANILVTAASVSTASASPIVTPPATGSSNSSTTGSSHYLFTLTLRYGSRGAGVIELQKRLISFGYLSATPSGYYGALTVAAVRKFQLAHKLAPVGFVGPGTRAVLNTGS